MSQKNNSFSPMSSKLINSTSESIKRPMEVARQMKDIKPDPYDLHWLIDEALGESDFRYQLPLVGVSISVPEKTIVLVDRELLREAFRNIIHNALRAMPDSGSLTIKAILNNDQKMVEVTFSDTGPGMSEKEKQAALSGFVATQNGTGLGVLISLLLIRAQNGDLKIVSKEREGTRVIVTLPTT